MSEYVHNKSIWYPVRDEDLALMSKYLGEKDPWNFEYTSTWKRIKEELKEIINGPVQLHIMTAYDKGNYNHYIELILKHDWCTEEGEFGRSRPLNETEQDKYYLAFAKLVLKIDPTKLKYVDYCWYNCSEPPDYYAAEDDFYKEI